MRPPRITSASSFRTRKIAATQINEYEKRRLEKLVRNNRRMQDLGIKSLITILNETSNPNNKIKQAKSKTTKGEDSGSGYAPEEEEGSERDENDDNSLEDKEVPMDDRCTSTSSRVKATKPSKMPPGARPPKRVLPPAETTQVARVTRFKSKQLTFTHDDEDRSQVREEVCSQRTTRNIPNLVESSQQGSDDDVASSMMHDLEQYEDVLGQFEKHIPLDDECRPPTPKKGRGHKPTIGKGLDQ